MVRNKWYLLLGLIALVWLLFFYFKQKDKNEKVEESSKLILEQVNQVGKLVVTEGNFSEVFNYKSSKEIFGSLLTAEKKALVVVNAKVTVSFDLSKMQYQIDEKNKVLRILSIPEEEIAIYPEFEYYDVQDDYFNEFEAKDYNAIKEKVNASLKKKIEASTLKTNAKERLLTELTKFYVLTSSLGWTLVYEEKVIQNEEDLKALKQLR